MQLLYILLCFTLQEQGENRRLLDAADIELVSYLDAHFSLRNLLWAPQYIRYATKSTARAEQVRQPQRRHL